LAGCTSRNAAATDPSYPCPSYPCVVPLPGTTRIEHLAANLAAADLRLANTDLQRLDAAV
jgi:aryl-alcohol dehydrogenase-like predicted oxidoreductase